MYQILWRYSRRDEFEVIDTAQDKNELDYLLTEYRMAYGGEGEFKTRKEKTNG